MSGPDDMYSPPTPDYLQGTCLIFNFGITPCCAQGLLLTLKAEIIPGSAPGIIGIVQLGLAACKTSSLPLYYVSGHRRAYFKHNV